MMKMNKKLREGAKALFAKQIVFAKVKEERNFGFYEWREEMRLKTMARENLILDIGYWILKKACCSFRALFKYSVRDAGRVLSVHRSLNRFAHFGMTIGKLSRFGMTGLWNGNKTRKAVATAGVLTLLIQTAGLGAFAFVPFASANGDSPLRIDVKKQAVSSVCGTAEITLTITGAGDPIEERKPIDVIFVIDRSGSMAGTYLDNVKTAIAGAGGFIDEMNFSGSDPDKVGIVSYAGAYSDLSQINYLLGSDGNAAKSAVNGLVAYGGTCIECGLNTAYGMLGLGNRDQFVILLSDGVANVNSDNNVCAGVNCPTSATECITNAIAEGSNIKNLGAPIYSIGYRLEDISLSCPAATENLAIQTLQDISSGSDYYFNGDPNNINTVFDSIAWDIKNIAGYDAKIVEVLPAGINYTGMISGQTPDSVSDQTITWEFGNLAIGEIQEVSFSVVTDLYGEVLIDEYPESQPDNYTRVEYNNYLDELQIKDFPETRISIDSCFPSEIGSITIIKDSQLDDPQSFEFTATGDLGDFILVDDGINPDDKSRIFPDIPVGSYTITEAATSGWTLDDIVCTGDDNPTIDKPNRTVTINLDDGENVVCTFTNTKDEDSPVDEGDVVINEIMWMGSSKNDKDQWIELKNVSDKILNLEGCQLKYKNNSGEEEELASLPDDSINPGEYYLVSHYKKGHSKISIDPDFGGTTDVDNFDLDNLQIKLYCGGDLIDTADDGLNEPFAGEYIADSVWKSMSRKSVPGTGTSADDWCTASTSENWDAGTAEKGTPGAPNICDGCIDNDEDDVCDDVDNCVGVYNPGQEDTNDNGIGDACEEAPSLGSISGCKYKDIENIGAIDEGEEKLSGWEIQLISCPSYTPLLPGDPMQFPLKSSINTNPEPGMVGYCVIITTTETDEDGCYSFDDLSAGDYGVSEITLEDWTQTLPANDTFYYFNLTAGETKTEIDFLNYYEEPTPTYQCSDGIDNDGDGLIDAADPGCHTDGDVNNEESYDPEDNDEYNPYCGDGVCNNNETCSSCPQDCGPCGGGGGGWSPPIVIKITDEKVSYLGDGNALVSWKTNVTTTNQVVYGDNSVTVLDGAPEYDYDSVNEESNSMYKEHEVMISGLTDGVTYYFRPVADRNGSAEVIGEEVSYVFEAAPAEKGEVKGETIEAPLTECNYLLEYIRLGADNNSVEVEKLERFLNEFEGENLPVNGIYEQADFDAVSRFQEKYLGDILSPWSYSEATGYVYITTKKKINEIYCQTAFSLTAEQEEEIASFGARVLDLLAGSAEASAGASDQTVGADPAPEDGLEGRVGGAKDEAAEETENGTGDEEEIGGEIADETKDEAGDESDEGAGAAEDTEDGGADAVQDDEEEDKAETAGTGYMEYLLWLAAIAVIAGVAWYYWPKKREEEEI